MKILITTDLYTVTTNGVVTSVRNLYHELTAEGHDVRILTLSETGHSRKEGPVYYIRSVSLENVYPNVRMPTSFRHRLIRELIQWKPDIIHSQCEFFTFQYALRISRYTGAPIVHTYHTLYEQYSRYVIPGKRLGRQVVRVLSKNRLKSVQQVIAPTAKVEHALRSYGLHNPISVVPSGIDLSWHLEPMAPEARRSHRQALGIQDDQTVLINLGRLGFEKNLDELVRFAASAIAAGEDLKFLIVGDGPARESLQAQADKLGIRDRVIFTGMVDPTQVHHYYQLGDIFVSASTSETQGLTYIEAAANGLPLLCRKDPCLQDVLHQSENGYTYTCEEEFLAALRAMRLDPKWLERAGNCSRRIAANYDMHRFGATMSAIYSAILKEKASVCTSKKEESSLV